jgi:hypothetical protein
MPPISTPDPKQALVLFSLLFTGDEPMMSRLRPHLEVEQRTSLENAGLISLVRRGRAKHVVLTDAAWDWAGKNLDVPISRQARANETLIAVLARLKGFLDVRGIALGEMVRQARAKAADAPVHEAGESKTEANGTTNVVARIRSICMHEAGGRPGVRVRLVDVRRALPDVSRAALDETLLGMQRSGAAVFFPLDNPQELFPEDERDALNIAGTRHHVVYLEG